MQTLAVNKSFSQSVAMLKSVVTPVMTVVAVAMMIATAIKLTNSTRISGVIFSSTFLFATLLAIFYRAVNPIGWTLVLAGMGYRTPTMGSIRVWLLAESRRWLPGGIWGYASRATQAGQLGVPVSVASASMLIELLITMAAAVLISGVGLLFHHGELTESILKPVVEMLNGRLTGVAVGAFFVCGVIGFAMRRTLHRKLAILLERFKLLAAVRFDWKILSAALGYMVLMAMINGAIGVCLLPMLETSASVPFAAMIAATASAWIIGFLAVFSPGGLFVREAALATLLLPWIPYETGISLAVLSRIAQLAAEMFCMIPILLPIKCSPQNGNLT